MSEVAAEVVYREAARSYRSLGWWLLALPVGVGLDLLVSGVDGAVTHLPGWIIAIGVLAGVHGLALYAVRMTHSLRVSADELAVGDEILPRADIVGVTPGVHPAGADTPTLGWPNGFPRGARGMTIRLADDRDVLVPTRFPDRLQDVLQVGAPEGERPVEVRVARADELTELATVDERAGAIFRVAGYDLPPVPFDEAGLADAALVLVVDDPVSGFARIDSLAGEAYLAGLSVLPSAMRRGHGTRLLDAACRWAAEQGYPSVVLTTFADVPWNAPFYAARGFVVVDLPSAALQAVRDREAALGLDDVGRRVVMRRRLAVPDVDLADVDLPDVDVAGVEDRPFGGEASTG